MSDGVANRFGGSNLPRRRLGHCCSRSGTPFSLGRLLGGLGSCLRGSLRSLLTVLQHRVGKHVGLTAARSQGVSRIHEAERYRTVNHYVGTHIESVEALADLSGAAAQAVFQDFLLLRHQRHRGIVTHGYLRQAVAVIDAVRQGGHVAGSVLHLGGAEHQQVARHAVEVQRIAPGFLLL